MRKLSIATCDDIVNQLNSGQSAKKIAKKMGISITSVSRIRNERCDDVTISKGGRPPKLSIQDKSWIVRQVTCGKAENAAKVAKNLQDDGRANASATTVRRTLKEAGLRSFVKQKKPMLLPRHIKSRYEFAQKYKDWTIDDWKRVVFSDETKINRLGSSDGREWAWKKPGAQVEQHHVIPTMKFGGGSLMIWGCMTYYGVGYACRIDGRMNAELYTTILNDELQESIDYFEMDRETLIFQQDNDPKHTSKMARKWFKDNSIHLLDWPAQSPDLNPIENLWRQLKQQLNAYVEPPKGMHELWERVEHEWEALSTEKCIDLFESMPRRVAAVYKAKGGYVKY